jgi:hypothetical protein
MGMKERKVFRVNTDWFIVTGLSEFVGNDGSIELTTSWILLEVNITYKTRRKNKHKQNVITSIENLQEFKLI